MDEVGRATGSTIARPTLRGDQGPALRAAVAAAPWLSGKFCALAIDNRSATPPEAPYDGIISVEDRGVRDACEAHVQQQFPTGKPGMGRILVCVRRTTPC